MKVDTVEGADEGVVYQSHVRRDVDDRVGELEGLAGWEGWRGELEGLTGLFLAGVSRSLKGWSAHTPSGFPLGDILVIFTARGS